MTSNFYTVQNCLVVSLTDRALGVGLQPLLETLLENISRSKSKGIILELSGVSIMDRKVAEKINQFVNKLGILGFACVLSGLKPGAVGALVTLEIPLEVKNITRNVDEALAILGCG
jgi:anti-anti-sigma regulatory factor